MDPSQLKGQIGLDLLKTTDSGGHSVVSPHSHFFNVHHRSIHGYKWDEVPEDFSQLRLEEQDQPYRVVQPKSFDTTRNKKWLDHFKQDIPRVERVGVSGYPKDPRQMKELNEAKINRMNEEKESGHKEAGSLYKPESVRNKALSRYRFMLMLSHMHHNGGIGSNLTQNKDAGFINKYINDKFANSEHKPNYLGDLYEGTGSFLNSAVKTLHHRLTEEGNTPSGQSHPHAKYLAELVKLADEFEREHIPEKPKLEFPKKISKTAKENQTKKAEAEYEKQLSANIFHNPYAHILSKYILGASRNLTPLQEAQSTGFSFYPDDNFDALYGNEKREGQKKSIAKLSSNAYNIGDKLADYLSGNHEKLIPADILSSRQESRSIRNTSPEQQRQFSATKGLTPLFGKMSHKALLTLLSKSHIHELIDNISNGDITQKKEAYRRLLNLFDKKLNIDSDVHYDTLLEHIINHPDSDISLSDLNRIVGRIKGVNTMSSLANAIAGESPAIRHLVLNPENNIVTYIHENPKTDLPSLANKAKLYGDTAKSLGKYLDMDIPKKKQNRTGEWTEEHRPDLQLASLFNTIDAKMQGKEAPKPIVEKVHKERIPQEEPEVREEPVTDLPNENYAYPSDKTNDMLRYNTAIKEVGKFLKNNYMSKPELELALEKQKQLVEKSPTNQNQAAYARLGKAYTLMNGNKKLNIEPQSTAYIGHRTGTVMPGIAVKLGQLYNVLHFEHTHNKSGATNQIKAIIHALNTNQFEMDNLTKNEYIKRFSSLLRSEEGRKKDRMNPEIIKDVESSLNIPININKAFSTLVYFINTFNHSGIILSHAE